MEQIYTIPINEAFEKSAADKDAGCPFCTIYRQFEENELSLILGASMMEPDIRIKTNEAGFCKEHFNKMLTMGKKLPLALILESHLDTVSEKLKANKLMPTLGAKKSSDALNNLAKSCYICDRLDYNFERVMNNAVYLFASDETFRRKCAAQPCFCIEHYAAFLTAGKNGLKGQSFNEFYKCISRIEEAYIKTIKENISFFAKKFDYRYKDEPWGDAKDAVEKTIEVLCGEYPDIK